MFQQPYSTLHLFNAYLAPSQNWAYKLIKHTPNTAPIITARHFLPTNFYPPEFRYISNPLDNLIAYNNALPRTALGLGQKVIIKSFTSVLNPHQAIVKDWIKIKRVELCHAHFADIGWEWLNVIQKAKIPYVISFYGFDYEKLPFTKPIYEGRYRKIFQKVDKIIVEGEHGKNILIKKGCPAEKIAIIRLGINPDQIEFIHRKKAKANLKLIQIADFAEKKGHIYTVHAFAEALKSCPNMHLTLAGGERDPGLKSQIKKEILNLNLSKYITIRDRIPLESLYKELESYHVFIHPSCYAANKDCEGGAPVVLLDAQATGMPIISTTHCDIPDEVIHTQTGLLCSEKNIMELTQLIQTFYDMDQLSFDQFSARAREHIKTNFDITQNAKKLYSLYSELIQHYAAHK